MKHLLLLLPLYARRKGGLLLALFCALATVAAGVGLLGVSGWFLTGAALAGAGAAFNLFAPSALVRGLSFLRIVSRYADRLAGHSATLRLLADLRTLVFRALIRLTPRQLARYRGGDLVARMTGDVDALDTVFLFVLAPLATALLAGAIMTAVLGYWIPAAALVFALALLVACVLAPWGLQRAARGPGAAAQESAAGLRAAVLDAVDGHADMVALHAQAQTRAHFERLCGQNAQARQAQACVAARGLWFLQAAGAAVLGVLWFGLGEHEGGGLSGPLLAGLLLAVMGIFEVAAPIMRGASRLGSAVSAAQRIREVAQCEPDMRDPDAPAALPADGALELDGLRFAYPDGALVLDGVSLRVAPGERVAIQGERRGQVHAAASDPAAGRSAGWSGALWRTRRARLRAGRLAPAHRAAVAGRAGVPGHAAHQSADRRPFGGRSRAVARAGRRAPGRFRARSARRAGCVGGRDRFAAVGRAGAEAVSGAGPAVAGQGAGAGRAHRRPGRGGRSRFPARSGAGGAGARRGAGHACAPAGGRGGPALRAARGQLHDVSSPEPVLA